MGDIAKERGKQESAPTEPPKHGQDTGKESPKKEPEVENKLNLSTVLNTFDGMADATKMIMRVLSTPKLNSEYSIHTLDVQNEIMYAFYGESARNCRHRR